MNYRQQHCILTVNSSGHCTKRVTYASINAAKRANRSTKYRVLEKKHKVPQAADYRAVEAGFLGDYHGGLEEPFTA